MEKEYFINYLREGYYFATYSLPGSGLPNVLFINSRLHFLFFPYLFSIFLHSSVILRKVLGWDNYSMPYVGSILIMIFLIFVNKMIFESVFGAVVEKGIIDDNQPKESKQKKGLIAVLFFAGGFVLYVLVKELIIIPFFT